MSGPPDLDPTIELDGTGLRVGGRDLPLYSGAVHYWRLDREAWQPALASLREMGVSIVETYAPWGVHEVAEGEYDFGNTDPRKDLGAFLDLIADEGLWAFVRPGPHINAELTYFGLPERVVYDPRCQARSPEQNPVILFFPPKMFPVPSYASETYFAEVERWYQRVGSVIAPRIYPEGPVVLLQVDNEGAYYFRNAPYDQDYHPDAVDRWHAFIKDRYGDIEAVAAAHQQSYSSWSDVDPPKVFAADRPEALARHLDWSHFHEHLITSAMHRLRDAMASGGMSGAPVLHNLPPGESGAPVHVPELQEAVDLVGLDYYHSASDYPAIKRRTLYMAGTLPFPYAPELGAGTPAWFTPIGEEESLFCAMTATAHGLRGFNLYMAVNRDRWVGAPIDRLGQPRPVMAKWKRLFEALADTDFPQLERRVEVAIVMPREYMRLSRATHLYGPLSATCAEMFGAGAFQTSREGTFGFDHEIQSDWWKAAQNFAAALTEAKVPYHFLDAEADIDRWNPYKLICCPTFQFLSPQLWARLQAAATQDTHIVHGPVVPDLDDYMAEQSFRRINGAHCIDLLATDAVRSTVAELIDELALERPYASSPASVETCAYADGDDDALIFVIQPADQPTTAEISVPREMRLVDAMTDERFDATSVATIPMPPRSCRMLMIETLHPSRIPKAAP